MRIRVCEHCGGGFIPSKYKPLARFCSAACRISGNAKVSAKARGDALRGRGEGKTYTKWYGRHEHRVVMEKKLGRELLPGEIVHHIDHNKKNNHPDNLMLMDRANHARHHATKNRLCELMGCSDKHLARGLCAKHYSKKRYERNKNANIINV